jgi:hypothetical protein
MYSQVFVSVLLLSVTSAAAPDGENMHKTLLKGHGRNMMFLSPGTGRNSLVSENTPGGSGKRASEIKAHFPAAKSHSKIEEESVSAMWNALKRVDRDTWYVAKENYMPGEVLAPHTIIALFSLFPSLFESSHGRNGRKSRRRFRH